MPRPRLTGSINVRLRPEEIDFLVGRAERYGISLSEALRGAVALLYLTDKRNGVEGLPESWIHPHDNTLLDVEDDDS